MATEIGTGGGLSASLAGIANTRRTRMGASGAAAGGMTSDTDGPTATPTPATAGLGADVGGGDDDWDAFGGDDGGGEDDGFGDGDEDGGAYADGGMREAMDGDIMRAAQARADELRKEKIELLNKLNGFASKGMEVRTELSMQTNLDDLRMECSRLQRDVALRASVKMQRRLLIGTVSVLEWGNAQYDPIGAELTGWSEVVMGSVDEYDNVFERLYEKYGGSGRSMPPELELLMMVGGSALMFHLSAQMAKQATAGGAAELQKAMAAAAMQKARMEQQQKSSQQQQHAGGGGSSSGGAVPPRPPPAPIDHTPLPNGGRRMRPAPFQMPPMGGLLGTMLPAGGEDGSLSGGGGMRVDKDVAVGGTVMEIQEIEGLENPPPHPDGPGGGGFGGNHGEDSVPGSESGMRTSSTGLTRTIAVEGPATRKRASRARKDSGTSSVAV